MATTRTYKTLTVEDQNSAKKDRLRDLEREHYDNVLALQQAQAKPPATPEEDEANLAEIARLESNIAIIDSALDALGTA